MMHVTKVRTFSSACSTPVAIESSCVREWYSLASISSSVRMSSGCLTLSFLTRTLRVAMMTRSLLALTALARWAGAVQCSVECGRVREKKSAAVGFGGAGVG